MRGSFFQGTIYRLLYSKDFGEPLRDSPLPAAATSMLHRRRGGGGPGGGDRVNL